MKSREPDGDSSELSFTYDSVGRGFQMVEGAGSGKSIRYEFDGIGRLTELKTRDPVAGAFRADTKLYYDASGQWSKWERFVDGQLQVVYSMGITNHAISPPSSFTALSVGYGRNREWLSTKNGTSPSRI